MSGNVTSNNSTNGSKADDYANNQAVAINIKDALNYTDTLKNFSHR